MKTLIVEDDFTSRTLMQEILKGFGASHVAINGREAVTAVQQALADGAQYDLICLDVMMPEMDGQEALRRIRELEEEHGIDSTRGAKIIMTTSLNDMKNVGEAYSSLCDAYLVKPIRKDVLLDKVKELGLGG